jgi:hypothetical protein
VWWEGDLRALSNLRSLVGILLELTFGSAVIFGFEGLSRGLLEFL